MLPAIGKKRDRGRAVRQSEVTPLLRHELTGGQLGHDPTVPTFGPSSVTEAIALGVDTVYACCRIIADGVSSAVWTERRGNLPLPASRIVRRPAESMTRREWLWRVVASMALYSFCPIELRGGIDSEGVPMSLVPRSPARFRVDTLRGVWTYDGTPIDPADWRIVQRTLWPTVGPAEGAVIKLARDMIAQAAAMDGYALEFWANGGAPLTVLRSDQELSKAQAQDAKATYAEARNAGPGLPLVLGKGLDISGFGVDIAQAQGTTADSRHELISSLGRYWGIPPNFLNAPVLSGNLVYQTVEAAGQYLVSYTLEPYAAAVADMMSELLPADYVTGRHVTLGLDHLSKPSPGARATYYQTMTAIGAMTVAEVRDAEGLPPQESPTTPTPVAEPSEVEI